MTRDSGASSPHSAPTKDKEKKTGFFRKFQQQKLPAWQPILTPGSVLPTFIVVGMVFIPIGVGLLHSSNQVVEKKLDYTNCKKNGEVNMTCQDALKVSSEACVCDLKFEITEDWKGKVFLYYALTKYYQNHRRYVNNRDNAQLLGQNVQKKPSTNCVPFAEYKTKINGTTITRHVAPCGAVANSLFNDTFTLKFETVTDVSLLRTGIAWESDKKYKFENPNGNGTVESLHQAFNGTHRPPNWQKEIWELDPANPGNNGLENEDFIVWMRTAAFPDFRKLYAIVNNSQENFKSGLPKGKYTLVINYTYPVSKFSGTKSVILSTTSFIGGKNPFLGYMYISVGGLCIIFGIILIFVHLKFGLSTRESIDVSPRTPYMS